MKEHKNFWDKNAGRYDRFMRKDRAAYEEMYTLIWPVVKAKGMTMSPLFPLTSRIAEVIAESIPEMLSVCCAIVFPVMFSPPLTFGLMTMSEETPLTAFWIIPRLFSIPLASPPIKSGIHDS